MTRVAAKAGAVTRHFRSFLRRRTRDFVLKNAEIGSCLLFFVFSLLVEKKAEDETKCSRHRLWCHHFTHGGNRELLAGVTQISRCSFHTLFFLFSRLFGLRFGTDTHPERRVAAVFGEMWTRARFCDGRQTVSIMNKGNSAQQGRYTISST